MEMEESVLDSIYEDDVEMADVEEGELVDDGLVNENGVCGDGTGSENNKGFVTGEKKSKRKKNRSRKNKKSNLVPKVTDVNRCLLQKSFCSFRFLGYLSYPAYFISFFNVDAIQACGGQMTADGRRQRTGGGILWNILKAREPKAYKEIMNKSREFEKQFRTHGFGHASAPQVIKMTSQSLQPRMNYSSATEPNITSVIPQICENIEPACSEELPEQSKLEGASEPKSVHDRVRVPVRYDDLFEGQSV